MAARRVLHTPTSLPERIAEIERLGRPGKPTSVAFDSLSSRSVPCDGGSGAHIGWGLP